jgi:hypothetical protein
LGLQLPSTTAITETGMIIFIITFAIAALFALTLTGSIASTAGGRS